MNRKTDKKQTNEQTELHQFQKEPSYDGDLCPCQVLNLIGQTVFELESGNKNVDGQMDEQKNGQKWTNGQKNGQTNRRNYTNFERNLAMMVVYVPVKNEFDSTNRF